MVRTLPTRADLFADAAVCRFASFTRIVVLPSTPALLTLVDVRVHTRTPEQQQTDNSIGYWIQLDPATCKAILNVADTDHDGQISLGTLSQCRR